MAYADINGARLAWQQLGEGPDLLLVHGLAANRAFWMPVALALQSRFRITLFDLRGHGYSSRPANGYRPQDFGLDLLGLMDVLKIERAALVGHSYGGAAALEAAGLAPQRVSHLALLDTRVARLQPLMRLHDCPRISDVERQVAATTDHDWERLPQVGYLFLEAAARMRLAGLPLSARDDFAPFGEGRGAARAARAWLDLLETTTAREQLDEPGLEAARMAALPMPVLLMDAEFSRCRMSADTLQRILARPLRMTVPGAGHFFPRSHGPWLVEQLLAFLR